MPQTEHLVARTNDSAGGSDVRHIALGACAAMIGAGSGLESFAQVTWRTPGTLSHARANVRLNTTTAGATLRVRKNGANGNQVVTVTALTTGYFEDLVNTDTVAAGDKLNYLFARTGGSGNFAAATINILFEATSGDSVWRWTLLSNDTVNNDVYHHLAGGSNDGALEDVQETTFPVTGTLSNGVFSLSSNSATGATVITLRKNQANAAITMSAGAGTTGHFEDLVNTVSVTGGDRGAWSVNWDSGVQTLRTIAVDYTTSGGMPFSTSDFSGGGAGTVYAPISGTGESPSATETDAQAKALVASTLADLTAHVTSNTGTITIRTRKNTADGNGVLSIGSTLTGWFADAVNQDAFAVDDLYDYSIVASSSYQLRHIGMGSVEATPGECFGGGEITVVADPTDGEDFSGRTLGVRAWLTIGYDDADRSFALDSYNHPETYYNGRKIGSLVTIGTITRQLSDRFASYKMADVTVEDDDASRLLSTLEAATATQHWANREARLYLASPTTIAAAGTPHTLFRGIWRGHDSTGLARTLTFTDRLGSEFSDFNLEDTIPRRLVTVEDFPDAPKDALGRVVPIAYGRLTDQNVETTEVGTVLPYNPDLPSINSVGCRDIAFPAGTLEGGIGVYVCGVKDGEEGPISNMAGTNHHDPHATQIGWDQNTTFDSYNIYCFGGEHWLDWTPQGGLKPGANVRFVRKLTHDNSTFDGWGTKDMSVILTSEADGTDALQGVALVSVDQGKGVVAPLYVGVRAIDGVEYHEWILCGHAIQHIEEIYVNELAQNIQTDDAVAGSGGPWLIPGYDAFTDAFGADTYRVINGHTYTLLYGLVGSRGPDTAAGIFTETSENGNVTIDEDVAPFSVSFCGLEDVGDGSGSTITLAPRIAFHLLDQWVLQNYETGTAWPASAESDDGVPWLNSASFDALEAIEARWVGGDGYEWAVYLDEPTTVRELLAELLQNSGIRFGQNQHGQIIAKHLNDATDLSTVRVITDVAEIVADTHLTRKVDELENKVVYDWKWRQATQVFEEEDAFVSDSTAIADNRNRIAVGDRRAFKFIRDETTAADVARRALLFGIYPPRYVDLVCTLHAIDVQLGDIISVTDVDGIGATGWTNRALWVLGIQTAINSLYPDQPPTITLSCVDVDRFMHSKVVFLAPGSMTLTGAAPRSAGVSIPAGALALTGQTPTRVVA